MSQGVDYDNVEYLVELYIIIYYYRYDITFIIRFLLLFFNFMFISIIFIIIVYI